MEKELVLSFKNEEEREKFMEEWDKIVLSEPHDYRILTPFNETKTIRGYCKEAFETAKEKGWHDQPHEMGTILCLIHGEVSEAMEADRRGEGWDRVTEELADVCIRIFDLCGSLNLDLEKAIIEKMEYNKTRSYKHGGKSY